MTNTPPPGLFDRTRNWVSRSITVRLVVTGFLVLLLLIPLSMVQSLIYERQERQQEAIAEVTSIWGGEQVVMGPVVSVPVDVLIRVTHDKGPDTWERSSTYWQHFLPEDLNVEVAMDHEMRYRGIYKVVGYKSLVTVSGHLGGLSVDATGPERSVRWQDAVITLQLSDLRGVRENITLQVGDTSLAMEPGLPTDDLGEVGVQASLPSSARDQRSTPFQFTLQLNGSERLSLVPIGRTTDVSLRADWPSPSFQGAFLPAERDITAQGFTSHWHVLHLNRPFPQQFTGARHDLFPSAFGVELKVPVDEYQKNTRAAKYGSLLITMVFAVFFFVEVLQRVRIHPLQYLLVGLALCIFYTLLLAISEQWGFGPAYLAAAVAVVALVVLYARHVFRSARATALLAGILVLVYGFIFTIINMEELSLLIGSIGLFITLAVVMYLSRKIDWYGEGS